MVNQNARRQRARDRQTASRRSSSPPAGGRSRGRASGSGGGGRNRTIARHGGAPSRSPAAYRADTAARPSRAWHRPPRPAETARGPSAAPAPAGPGWVARHGGQIERIVPRINHRMPSQRADLFMALMMLPPTHQTWCQPASSSTAFHHHELRLQRAGSDVLSNRFMPRLTYSWILGLIASLGAFDSLGVERQSSRLLASDLGLRSR